MDTTHFDWQGHRGCRGLFPENSIPAFIKAIDLGMSTLEMDVAVSSDHKIIVTHEPWMSGSICLTPDFERIDEEMEQLFKIYDMEAGLISIFDCGSIGNHRFPGQEKISVGKPSLVDVFKSCEQHIEQNGGQKVNYNIEIKSKPEWDSVYTPSPGVFSDLLVGELQISGIDMSRFCLQSFDLRVLRHIHSNYPDITLALLVEKPFDDISLLVDDLGFTPNIFSPYYILLDQPKIEKAHQAGMKVIPWTVNDRDEMQKLMDWGVDGIITDYPDIPSEFYLKGDKT